jgi:uncharacterized protein YlxW (UPF0749 family)
MSNRTLFIVSLTIALAVSFCACARLNQISGTNLVHRRTKLTLQSLVRKLQHAKRRLASDPKQAVKIISDVEE